MRTKLVGITLTALLPLLPLVTEAQKSAEEPAQSFAIITQWRDSLRTLGAPSLIPKRYDSWRRHYERVQSEYRHDSTGSAYRVKAQKCSYEFQILEPMAYAAHFLSAVDTAIGRAKSAGANKYAPATYSRAEKYRAECVGALEANRQDLSPAYLARSRAAYEAQHALNLAGQIKPLPHQKNQCEQTILHSESQLRRLGKALEIQLRFSGGSDTAVTRLAKAIAKLNFEKQEAHDQIADIDLSIGQMFEEIGINQPTGSDAKALVAALSEEFRQLVRELDESKRELRQYRQSLSELKLEKETTETILSSKQAEEQRFAKTKRLFNSAEAIVLYNGSHDIVIRLRGITFPSGVAQLSKNHDSLLAKVTNALTLSSSAHIVVEGHTDNTGGAKLNVRLSKKRAEAVMSYLIESSGRSAEDFEAIGYGAEKPVANNQTEHGRKENRRIDIIIVR